MTDEHGKHGKHGEFEELEPLETLEHMEELHELEPIVESAAAPAAAAGADRTSSDASGGKRELEQTPVILRKASMILFAGSMLPWLVALKAEPGAQIAWDKLYTAKAVALVAAWLFHQGFLATHGGPAAGLVKSLAGAHKAIPAALAGVIALASVYLGYGHANLDSGAAMAEVATMLLAAATFSHIWGYEHGGKFNPIYPIMFLGPALAGLLSVFGVAAQFKNSPGLAAAGLVGCLTVGAGGCMAIYALYQAMKQAKIEGEEKKRLQREHRKAQRDVARKGAGS